MDVPKNRTGSGMWLPAIVAAFTVGAFALRWRMAGGPLWLDEIASLGFATETGLSGVFVPHDNNHLLNTLWLHLVGADAPVRLQRGLSIAFGTAAVPLAAVLMRSRGAAASAAAAAAFAVCWPLVVYGSEARGYAGFVVAALLLTLAADRHLGADPPWARWLAAAAVALGLACHAVTAFAGVAVAAALVWARIRDGIGLDAAIRRTVRFLLPAALVGAGLVGLAAWQAVRAGGLAFGGVVPFSPERFAAGYTGMLAWTLGAPAWIPPVGAVLLAVAVVAMVAGAARSRTDLPLLGAGLLAAPAAMLALMPPNTEFPRYHLVAGLALLIGLAAGIGGLWARGAAGRFVAVAAGAAFFAGHAVALAAFDAVRRGDLPALLAAGSVDAPQPVRVGGDRDLRTAMLVAEAARRTGIRFEPVPAHAVCPDAPVLMLVTPAVDGRWSPLRWPGAMTDPPPDRSDMPADCPVFYRLVGVDRVSAISGLPQALYRRSDGP